MARQQERLIDFAFAGFLRMPFWVGPLCAVLGWSAFWFAPLLFPPKPGEFDLFGRVAPFLAWLVGGVILLAWIMAELVKAKRRIGRRRRR